MTRSFSLTVAPLVATFLFASSASVQAQFGEAGDPFGIAAPTGAAEPVTDPFGTTTPSLPPRAAAAARPAEAEESEKDPLILSVRATNPTTAESLVWAAETTLNLDRADEAQRYLKRLLDGSPSPEVLTALHRKHGSSLFLRFIMEERLRPEGRQLGQAVMQAAYDAARDPARLQSLIANLTDPASEVRREAYSGLREAGDAGAVALIDTLSDDARAAQHAAARLALIGWGQPAEGPLLAALEAPDPTMRATLIDIVGHLESRTAVAFVLRPSLAEDISSEEKQAAQRALMRLIGSLPGRHEAEGYLFRRGEEYLRGQHVRPVDVDGNVDHWTWDAAAETVTVQRLDARRAALETAARIGRELCALSPDNAEYRRLRLIASLESAKLEVGYNEPLPTGEGTVWEVATTDTAEDLEDALAFALKHGYTGAAIGALEALAEVGNASLLENPDGQPRQVTRALQHPDQSVRFAAAMAIMRWDPQLAYPGASYLPETLAYFARTTGSRRVLVGHPRVTQAQTLVGMLNGLGFDAEAAPSSRGVFRAATASPDLDLLFISDALDGPPVEELVQQLRRDARTANLPVGVMAREHNLSRLRRFTDLEPLTETFPRPHTVETLSIEVRRLLDLTSGEAASEARRLHRAEIALEYLAHLAAESQRYRAYDVLAHEETLIQALYQPSLTRAAAVALGQLGSPDAQRALVTVASQNTRDIASRRAAADAFGVAVQRRGLLLSRAEILLQYDRYNESATLDRDTQKVLGSVLDWIELPSLAKKD
jgi:hypothetical protein